MADRFFLESPPVDGRVTLVGDEAHHLAHVMRAKSGDQVMFFDGTGFEYEARVECVGRAAVELTVLARNEVDRELPLDFTLAVALPKGDRQRWLVEKVVELGVRRLLPLETTRGVAQPVEKALARLRRAVIEASKQCGRNRLMEIAEPRRFADFVTNAGGAGPRALADPSGDAGLGTVVEQLRAASGPASLLVAVGPEGGWTTDELAAARKHGWLVVNLGPRILRVETAAICLAAVVGQARDDGSAKFDD